MPAIAGICLVFVLWVLLLLPQKYLGKEAHHQQKPVLASLYSFLKMSSNYFLKIIYLVAVEQLMTYVQPIPQKANTSS